MVGLSKMAALFPRVGSFSSEMMRSRILRIASNIKGQPWHSKRTFVTANATRGPQLCSVLTAGVAFNSRICSVWRLQGARQFSLKHGVGKQTEGATNTDALSNPFVPENQTNFVLDEVSGNAEIIRDMADVATTVSGQPSLAEVGLGGWSPIGFVQQSLESLTLYMDIPWISSIVILTATLRLVMLPLIIKAQINTAKLNNIKPQIDEIQARLKELMNSQDSVAKATASLKLQQLYKDNGCHPIKSFLAPLIQIPLFISFFVGLRRMCNLPVESMQSGGMMWFADLTTYDPYFVLPLVCSFSMLATIEMGSELGVNNPQMNSMKTVMRIMALMMIPLTAQFPAAIFTYWITSNVFSIGQVGLLKIPAMRKALGIPDMVIHGTPGQQENFWDNFKAGYKNAQEIAVLRNNEKMKRQRQKAVSSGPMEQTYDHNPLPKQNQELFNRATKKQRRRNRVRTKPGADM